MKCDMCYDRTSVGKRPMCATVCPSQALAYVRPRRLPSGARSRPTFLFRQPEDRHQGLHDGSRRAPRPSRSTWSITCGRSVCRLFRSPSSEPLWKDEFSVFTSDERYVTRRQFTKFLTLTSLGMFVGNLWILVRSSSYEDACVSIGWQSPQVGEIPVGRREAVRLSRRRRTTASWSAQAKMNTSPTARNARISPALSTTPRRTTAWNAPATRVFSR